MNDLIRSALALPACTPWPPDHRTLLGLSEADVSPAQVEAAVVERMERLRAYQLAHPDEVTEAMNRLARALVELSRPATAPPKTVDPPPPQASEELELTREPPAIVVTPTITEEPRRHAPPPMPPQPALELLPESFVATSEEFEVRRPFQELRKTEAPEAATPSLNLVESKPPPQVLADVPKPWPVAPYTPRAKSSPRRAAVHEIVRYRKLLRAWDTAGVFLDQPEIIAMTRAESIGVLLALSDIEASAWALHENGPGGRILALARSRPNVGALWELPHGSREVLRDDWRAGRLRVLTERQRLRQAALSRRPARELRRGWQRLRGVMPQATVIAASLVAFAIGVVRLFM